MTGVQTCALPIFLSCGVGELLVDGGDDIRNQGTNNYVGKDIDSYGTVTLDGHGSSWNMDRGQTGFLYVGQFGTGEVTVSGGADLIAEKVRIGYSDMHDRTGVGTVTVTGNGSTMDDDASLMSVTTARGRWRSRMREGSLATVLMSGINGTVGEV